MIQIPRLLFRQRRLRLVAALVALFVCVAFWPGVARAEHMTITSEPTTVESMPGTTSTVNLTLTGNDSGFVCLDAFLEADVAIALTFPQRACGFGETLNATLTVAVGPEVAPGTYQAVVVASVVLIDGQQIHAELILPIVVLGCSEYVVTLEGAGARLPPNSTAVAALHATVVDPKEATWTFAAQDVPPGVTVTFVPASFVNSGTTQVRISIGANVPFGIYPIKLIPICNGQPLAASIYRLIVLGTLPTPVTLPTATAALTPSATPTATPSATATATATPSATPSPTPYPTYTPYPTHTAVPLPDITITGIEVTQAIQNLANEAPLIANKQTVVRVYIRVDQGFALNVNARLVGKFNGAPLPGSPRAPQQPIVALQSDITTAIRDNMAHISYLFKVPTSWTVGTITFDVEVNHDRAVLERDYTNNTGSRTVIFHRTPPLKMWLVRIRYDEKGTILTPSWNDFWPAQEWMLGVYPVPAITVFDGGVMTFDGDLSTTAGVDDLLNALWWKDLFTIESFGQNTDENSIWYGFIHENVTLQYNGKPLLGKARDYNSEQVISKLDSRQVGVTLAHEIGHALGRWHVNCGGTKGNDPNYPYPGDQLSNGGATDYYGFDTRNTQVIKPTVAKDFMSYCYPAWVSDYTYRALWNIIRSNFGPVVGAQVTAAAQPQEMLAVTGVINAATFTATVDHAYRVDDLTLPYQPGSGPYAVELQDARDELLFTHHFDVANIEAEDSDQHTFAEFFPYLPTTTQLRIKQGETTLLTRTVSANAPQITLTSPNGGEVITGTVELTWTATDPDGDELRYMVQYSKDGGDSWQSVAIDLTEPRYALDTNYIAGSKQALIQVRASDGINTGQDRSDNVFTVLRKAPDVQLIEPTRTLTQTITEPLRLTGYAYDMEDGILDDTALSWRSDREGELGTGANVQLDMLSPGEHIIVLTAADRDGNQSSVTKTIVMPHLLYLPLIQQGH